MKGISAVMSIIVLLATVSLHAATDLEVLFVGMPRDLVARQYQEHGGMTASNVMAWLKDKWAYLLCPPLKTIVSEHAHTSVSAVTERRYPIDIQAQFPPPPATNAAPSCAPTLVLLPASTESRQCGATLRVQDAAVTTQGMLRCTLWAELTMQKPDSYDATCFFADSSRTNVTVAVPAYTSLACELTLDLADDTLVLLGAQEFNQGVTCFAVLRARTL